MPVRRRVRALLALVLLARSSNSFAPHRSVSTIGVESAAAAAAAERRQGRQGRQRRAVAPQMILGMERRPSKGHEPASSPPRDRPRCLDAACEEENLLYESEASPSDGTNGGPPKNPLATGVVVGSVAALAATPAAEVRTLVLDLCESMPPEAFKAFLQRISAALPPSVHRALVARYGGVLMGGFGTGAVNRFLSRRLAKKAVALWLQRTESQELREIVSAAFTALPEETMEAVVPFANAFVEKAGSRKGTVASELLAATSSNSNATNWGSGGPGATIIRGFSSGAESGAANATSKASPGEVRSVLMQLKAEEVDNLLLSNQVQLITALGDAEEVNEGEIMQAYTAAVTLPIPSAALVQELPPWAKQRLLADEGLPLPYALPEAMMDTMLLLGTPPPAALRALPRTAFEAHNLLAAVVAATAITTTNALTSPTVGGAAEGGASHPAATAGATSDPAGDVLRRQPPKVNGSAKQQQVPLGVVIGQAFEQLPPSFVGDQLAEIIDKIPPKVLIQEASNIVDALPPSTLTELADRLADALPASALRQLVFEIVDPYIPGKSLSSSSSSPSSGDSSSSGGSKPPASVAAAIPADTASLASEVAIHCSEAALRRTVAELLASIPPAALKERLQRLVDSLGPEGLHKRALQILRVFSERTAKFRSFKDMRAAAAAAAAEDDAADMVPVVVQDASGATTSGPAVRKKGGILGAARMAAGRLTTRRKTDALKNVVGQIPPDLLASKVVETIARLPPESFSSLAQDLSQALWELLVARAGARRAAAVATGATTSAGVMTGAVLGTGKTSLATKGTAIAVAKAGVGGAGIGASSVATAMSAATATVAPIGSSTAGPGLAAGAVTAVKGAGVVKGVALATALAAGATYVSSSSGERPGLFDITPWEEDSIFVALICSCTAIVVFADGRGPGGIMEDLARWWNREPQASKRLLLELVRTSPTCRGVLYEPALAQLQKRKEADEKAEAN